MLIAGQIADRYDRRRMLQICLAVEALVAAALALATISGWISK
jgi:MFS family permease